MNHHKETELEVRATEALCALLGQVSAVKVTDLERKPPARGHGAEILVHVDVFGHEQTLACKVNSNARLSEIRSALKNLHDLAAHRSSQATAVLIAPSLSPEAQALCKENQAGFMDLEGNARLTLGEVFIVKRTLHQHTLADKAA